MSKEIEVLEKPFLQKSKMESLKMVSTFEEALSFYKYIHSLWSSLLFLELSSYITHFEMYLACFTSLSDFCMSAHSFWFYHFASLVYFQLSCLAWVILTVMGYDFIHHIPIRYTFKSTIIMFWVPTYIKNKN